MAGPECTTPCYGQHNGQVTKRIELTLQSRRTPLACTAAAHAHRRFLCWLWPCVLLTHLCSCSAPSQVTMFSAPSNVLQGAHMDTPHDAQVLAHAASGVRSLSLRRAYDRSGHLLPALASACTRLSTLVLQHTCHSRSGMGKLRAEWLSGLAGMPSLKEVELWGVHPGAFEAAAGPVGLLHKVTHISAESSAADELIDHCGWAEAMHASSLYMLMSVVQLGLACLVPDVHSLHFHNQP